MVLIVKRIVWEDQTELGGDEMKSIAKVPSVARENASKSMTKHENPMWF